MPSLPPMTKHRGFPSRLPGTEFQFTIRRASPKPTPLAKKERYPDRKDLIKEADTYFISCLWEHFGNAPFERGNLDASRLNSLFMREVFPYREPFSPTDYEALLIIDETAARVSFPQAFGD